MKAVILAGGFGTRLGEYTDLLPKPMVSIGTVPMLVHIMKIYSRFGVKDFVIAGGYKAEVIKRYFLELPTLASDFTIDLKTSSIKTLGGPENFDWRVTIVDTGLDTMTGGRLARLKPHLNEERFFLTYGDGLSDVDLEALLEYHRQFNFLVTTTAVRPTARFGELDIQNGNVLGFKEKPQLQSGWINGGFFVMEPEFLEYLEGDATVLEGAPLEEIARIGKLGAFTHEGFWQCMDTKRDKDYLENLWSEGNAPWL